VRLVRQRADVAKELGSARVLAARERRRRLEPTCRLRKRGDRQELLSTSEANRCERGRRGIEVRTKRVVAPGGDELAESPLRLVPVASFETDEDGRREALLDDLGIADTAGQVELPR